MDFDTNKKLNTLGHTIVYSKLLVVVLTILGLGLLVGCSPAAAPPPTPTPPALADELVLYNWAEYMPQSILDAFSKEYGVRVKYVTYDSQEEAVANIRAGEVYDVVVLENAFVPALAAEGLLAEIDYRNVLNFDNISDNFRNLAYDPNNVHAVPYNWGTTGLVVRSDLVEKPISSWAELWEPPYAGKVAMRMDGVREPLGVALKSVGYSINSEEQAELESALAHLIELNQAGQIKNIDSTSEAAISALQSEEVLAVVGWPIDVLVGREENEAITYVLPEEGGMIWGDNFVIPVNSPNKYTAELFINFVLRPENGAKVVNEFYAPTANKAAFDLIDPAIRDDPVVYPPNENLQNAEVLLPLSPEGEKLYEDIWQQFEAAQ